MKLVWAVVQSEDAGNALKTLQAKGYRSTRINTVGGLLKRGNVSLLTGVEAEQVTSTTDLPAVLAGALASRRPRLIDVPVDPSGYPALLQAIRG